MTITFWTHFSAAPNVDGLMFDIQVSDVTKLKFERLQTGGLSGGAVWKFTDGAGGTNTLTDGALSGDFTDPA